VWERPGITWINWDSPVSSQPPVSDIPHEG
jgi:hypothetical protein